MDGFSSPCSQKRILVIDDESTILDLVSYYLENEGHSLTFARDGRQGLERFAEESFDIVISDRNMPGMTGDDLAEAIRSRNAQVPIILITGNRGPDVDVSRFDAFLPKPFTRTELIAAIEDALFVHSASFG